jgi:hypothetical protein
VGVPHSLSDVEWVRIEPSPPVVGAARTAASGLRRPLPSVPTELAGYLIAIVTIGVLVNAIIFTLPMLADSLRVAVAIYLGILAIRLWWRGALEIVGRRLVRPRDFFERLFSSRSPSYSRPASCRCNNLIAVYTQLHFVSYSSA